MEIPPPLRRAGPAAQAAGAGLRRRARKRCARHRRAGARHSTAQSRGTAQNSTAQNSTAQRRAPPQTPAQHRLPLIPGFPQHAGQHRELEPAPGSEETRTQGSKQGFLGDQRGIPAAQLHPHRLNGSLRF